MERLDDERVYEPDLVFGNAERPWIPSRTGTASEAYYGPYETPVYRTRSSRPHMEKGQWCPFG
eukprot:scaffold1558_cov356-Pavlova_lutheri.AAC.5